MATVVTEIDIADGIEDITGFTEYDGALVLLRMRGRVVGTVRVPVHLGFITATDVRDAMNRDTGLCERAMQAALDDWLLPATGPKPSAPTWTVVVCTRDRTEELRRCLDSLVAAGVTDGEVIIVDNGPSDDATMRLCADYPVRYVRTERAGLNHARTLGARYASGEVVIYTDDDVVVDSRWIPAVLDGFAAPRVGAVTGPAIPHVLGSDAQDLFERYSPFGRGFVRKEFDYTNIAPSSAGRVGSGLNMAIRRGLILGRGLFDAELDRGTRAITGGDTYAFYRLLSEGYRIVYTPDAIVRHVHRAADADVRATIFGYAVGVFAFLTRCVLRHRDLIAARTGLAWFVRHHMRQLARTILRRPGRFPLRLILADIAGILVGPVAYLLTVRAERKRHAAVEALPLVLEPADELARV